MNATAHGKGRMTRLKHLSLWVPALLLGVTAAHARTWRIRPDGTGDAPTIQAGIDGAIAGDSILVAAGTYYENLDTSGKRLALLGAQGSAASIIDGGYSASVVRLDGGGLLESLTLRHGQAANGGGLYVSNATGATIRQNIIEDNTAGAGLDEGLGGGVFLEGLTDAVCFEDNIVRNNTAGDSGGGIYDEGGLNTPNVLRHNTIVNNTCYVAGGGISTGFADVEYNLIIHNISAHFGGGLHVLPDGQAIVRNNTVAENRVGNTLTNGAGIHVSGAAHVISNIAMHNIYVGYLSGDRGAGIYCDGAAVGADVRCNDTWANNLDGIVGFVPQDPSNFSQDPLFCDALRDNYHLSDRSPCVAAHNGCSSLIGALGENCTTSDVLPPLDGFTMRIAPNPPRTSATIQYCVPRTPGVARVAIYDLAGHVVCTLPCPDTPRGSVIWSGRDRTGRPVAAGLYLVRLETQNASITRKLTWMR
jgi:hypothetical protein